jgi:lysozyme family protein
MFLLPSRKIMGLNESSMGKPTMEFEQAVSIIMKIEGGFTQDSLDPGGATKWGISQKSFPDINIKSMTDEQARSLYFTHYWIPGKCALLPERIRLIYFDMCVHQGISSAVITLQKALNGSGYAVEIDGIIGTETIEAAAHLEQDRLRSYRVLRLSNIVSNKPEMEKYWYGWYKRASTI